MNDQYRIVIIDIADGDPFPDDFVRDMNGHPIGWTFTPHTGTTGGRLSGTLQYLRFVHRAAHPEGAMHDGRADACHDARCRS